MNLRTAADFERLRGLYLYDFGTWTAAGYTAEEIAVLLESEQYRGGKVYKIVRATPDGRMELRGVAPQRFQAESGMFFYRHDPDLARTDFNELRLRGERARPPARAYLQLAQRLPAGDRAGYVTALIHPAEYEDEFAQWLGDFAGGDWVEGGISHVTNYHNEQKVVLERHQLWSQAVHASRPAAEVLASVRRIVQR